MPVLVPAAVRAMTLFEVFAREKRALSNSELARLLDLPESSCSDLVHTLANGGFLMRTAKSRRIYPTSRLLGLASDIAKSDPLFSAMLEGCELLRDKTGESALAGRVEDGVVRVVAFCEGKHPLRYAVAAGDKLSLHVSALGKAVLALGSPEEAARQLRIKPLKKLASGTQMNLGVLEAQIAEIRRRGWVLVENEGGEDLAALAMGGMINGAPFAISIAGPVGRLRFHHDEHLEALKAVQLTLFNTTGVARKVD
jgi:DNA-binding IclR family transcriptional regulator